VRVDKALYSRGKSEEAFKKKEWEAHDDKVKFRGCRYCTGRREGKASRGSSSSKRKTESDVKSALLPRCGGSRLAHLILRECSEEPGSLSE